MVLIRNFGWFLQTAMAIPLSLKRMMAGSVTLRLSLKLIAMATLLSQKRAAGSKAMISPFFFSFFLKDNHIYSLFFGNAIN